MRTVAHIPPMLALAGEPPTGPDWAFEFKWDGQRAIVTVTDGAVRITSRTGKNITRTYWELAAVITNVIGNRPGTLILDGEIVALDDQGRPDIALLQARMHVQRPSTALVQRVPVYYFAFDVLVLDGASVTSDGYAQRRALLDGLGLDGQDTRVRVPANYTDVDGTVLLAVARDAGLEGIIAKHLRSRYESGRRSPSWTKTSLRTTHDVVIGGWRTGEGRPLGALLMGAYDDEGRLQYLGRVGSGFTEDALREIAHRLAAIEQADSPFGVPVVSTGAHWVAPVLVGEVEYRGTTETGRLLYPSWRGLRADIKPSQVVISY
jgi:bifunctional non-homologous end joining protein LigD